MIKITAPLMLQIEYFGLSKEFTFSIDYEIQDVLKEQCMPNTKGNISVPWPSTKNTNTRELNVFQWYQRHGVNLEWHYFRIEHTTALLELKL